MLWEGKIQKIRKNICRNLIAIHFDSVQLLKGKVGGIIQKADLKDKEERKIKSVNSRHTTSNSSCKKEKNERKKKTEEKFIK